eukprot:SAG22_NODE_19_length_32182_cov_39.206963_15_plen_195_part_00
MSDCGGGPPAAAGPFGMLATQPPEPGVMPAVLDPIGSESSTPSLSFIRSGMGSAAAADASSSASAGPGSGPAASKKASGPKISSTISKAGLGGSAAARASAGGGGATAKSKKRAATWTNQDLSSVFGLIQGHLQKAGADGAAVPARGGGAPAAVAAAACPGSSNGSSNSAQLAGAVMDELKFRIAESAMESLMK